MTPLRIGFVPGVTPDKWIRRWRERRRDPIETVLVAEAEQRAALDDAREGGPVHMCLVRLPIERDGLHVITLYAEDVVVVMGVDNELSVLDELAHADLATEIVHHGDVRTSVETVAAGTGVVVVPRSVARLHARRDVTSRRLVDADESEVALAWRRDLDDQRVQDFVGIVRGRTERSSRN